MAQEVREFRQKNKYIIGAGVTFLVIGLVIGLAIGFAIAKRAEQPSSDCVSPGGAVPWCASDWILHQNKCYYLSTEEKNWTSSQNFCSLHNASLARVENDEKAFVMLLKGKNPCWIGLKREPGQPWEGPYGENATLEILGNGGNCAYLNDEAKASSSKCDIEHHWICSKTDPSKHL